tara:strand:+ start:90 stop:461 length:372 start_codon:yes stop_codon:yes gene_type:complete
MDKKTALDLLQPVIESAVILAAKYAKESGRDTVTLMDINYAMKFCGRYITGNQIGTMFPEIYDSSDSEDEGDDDRLTEDETVFTRYNGDNQIMKDVNECYDSWDNWEPDAPILVIIKNAIDNI